MKHRFFTILSCPLLLLASGCSSETNEPDEPVTPVEENSNTLTIRIAQSDFTRADENETKVNTLYVVFLRDNKVKEIKGAKKTDNPNVFKVDVPGSLTESHPTGIIAYANCTTNDQTLDALKNRTLDNFGNSTSGFAMSSVSSFNESGTETQIIPVSFEHFTQSGKELDLNLERICAKVTLNRHNDFQDNTQAIEGEKELGIYLSLDGWTLSGIDKQTYLFKNYNGTMPEDLWWLSSEKGRSSTHWAFSSQYSISKFPQNNSDFSDEEINAIKYAHITDTPKELSTSTYCHETTRPKSTYDDPNALPSIVLIGTYRKSNNNQSTPEDLYRLADGSFKTVIEYWNLIASEPAMLKKTSGQTTAEDLKSILTIDNHVAGTPDRIVEIKLKNNITDEELTPFGKSTQDVETINKYLKEKFGYAEKYYQGKCYFIIPIQNKNYKSNLTADNQPEGAFGVVRNHHYSITLKGITGVGFGVADANSYLLQGECNPSAPQYSIEIKTSINDWTEISDQTIE